MSSSNVLKTTPDCCENKVAEPAIIGKTVEILNLQGLGPSRHVRESLCSKRIDPYLSSGRIADRKAVQIWTRLDGARSAPPLETQALAAMIVIRCRSGGMADAGDSKSPAPRGLEGSTPSSGTKERLGVAERLQL